MKLIIDANGLLNFSLFLPHISLEIISECRLNSNQSGSFDLRFCFGDNYIILAFGYDRITFPILVSYIKGRKYEI